MPPKARTHYRLDNTCALDWAPTDGSVRGFDYDLIKRMEHWSTVDLSREYPELTFSRIEATHARYPRKADGSRYDYAAKRKLGQWAVADWRRV